MAVNKKAFGIGIGLTLGLVFGLSFVSMLGLITADVTTIASLNAGTPCTDPGQILAWSGSTFRCDESNNPDLVETWTEEFEGGSTALYATNCSVVGKFTGSATGTSACGYNNPDTIRGTTMSLTTSTGATDGIRGSRQAGSVVFGTVPQCVKFKWKVHNLSTANTQYVTRLGFMQPASNALPSNAVVAAYDFANNGNVNKWQLTTSAGGTSSSTICTGSTGDITADQWFTINLCVNAAANLATMTVNGNLCATTSANIPTGTGQSLSTGYQHFNASGAAPIAQLAFIDVAKGVIPFSVAR